MELKKMIMLMNVLNMLDFSIIFLKFLKHLDEPEEQEKDLTNVKKGCCSCFKKLEIKVEKDKYYCSLILETGFNLFFLIAYYAEFKGNPRISDNL